MTTAIVTSRGRITIPANVRPALGADTGDRIEFVEIKRSVTELKGMFGKSATAVSIEDMNRAIATTPLGDWRRCFDLAAVKTHGSR